MNPFDEIIDVGEAPDARAIAVSCIRIADARRARSQRDAMVRASEHVVIVVTEGSGRHLIEMVDYDADPSVVLHVQPGQIHRWDSDGQFDVWAISI